MPPDTSPCRASQVPGQSVSARRPQPPRTARRLRVPVASPPVVGFAIFGRFGHGRASVTRPNRVHAQRIAADAFAFPDFVREDYST